MLVAMHELIEIAIPIKVLGSKSCNSNIPQWPSCGSKINEKRVDVHKKFFSGLTKEEKADRITLDGANALRISVHLRETGF